MRNFSLPESSKKKFYEFLFKQKELYMNNISFQGKTNLIFDNTIYDKALAKRVNNGITYLNLRPKQNCKIFNGRYTALDLNETPEVAVLLIKEKGGIFFHNAKTKIMDILDCIDKMKASTKENLTAWIIGGKNNSQTTRDITSLAEVLCDRADIDTSIIAGKKQKLVPNITIHPTCEKLDISFSLPDKTKLSTDLENYFDIVELNNTAIS